MQKFTAVVFFSIGRYLAYAISGADKVSPETQITAEPNVRQTDKGKVLVAIRNHCETIDLKVSVKCADSILASVAAGTTVRDYSNMLNQLQNTIQWEMEDRLFMFIPSERTTFYNHNELFGADVNRKFPEVQFDISEAGNTYACGRGTACVFHLMRIMEVAVQRFGTSLGITLTGEKNWQSILDEVNKTVKVLPPKDAKTIALSEVSATLYHVKVAWRNPTMHPKQTYTLEEADNIMIATKTFMRNLAGVV